METVEKAQFSNADSFILVTPSSIVTDERLEHSEKAKEPMVFTLPGIVTSVM